MAKQLVTKGLRKKEGLFFRIYSYKNVLFILFLLTLLFGACNNKQVPCEAFDFKKIPYDASYYKEGLVYVSEHDTLTLFLKSQNHSKESVWGSMGYDCNPSFELDFHDQGKRLNILFSFHYFDMNNGDNSTYLNIVINSSRLELNLDSIKSNLDKEFTFTNFEYLQLNDLKRIRKIKFQNMRITEIETKTGKVWKLFNKNQENQLLIE